VSDGRCNRTMTEGDGSRAYSPLAVLWAGWGGTPGSRTASRTSPGKGGPDGMDARSPSGTVWTWDQAKPIIAKISGVGIHRFRRNWTAKTSGLETSLSSVLSRGIAGSASRVPSTSI
jgi:hypothetical protein